MASPRNPNRRFTEEELRSLILAISHLDEFFAGYVETRAVRQLGAPTDSAISRFCEMALLAYTDGFYPASRECGLLPVLRMAGCHNIASKIEAALDRPCGNSTYAAIANVIRDRAIAHPHFSKRGMMPIVDNAKRHLSAEDDIAAFQESTYVVQHATAEAFYWFRHHYPELVREASKLPSDAA